MHKTLSLAAVAAFSFAVTVAWAAPVTGYYFPSSVQVGTKTRVVIGGQALNGVQHAWVSGGGVKVTRITHPHFPRSPGKTQIPWVMEWAYEQLGGVCTHHDLPPEALADDSDWQECEWWKRIDELDNLDLQVLLRFIYTPEFYPQPTPALDTQIILDVEVAPDAKPGRREIMVYDGHSMSPPHPFYVTAEKHLVEPFFSIPPWKDRHMRVPGVLHYPTNLPVQTLPVVLDGQCWPGENDEFRLKLKKGIRLTCEVNAREMLPYLGDAVPGFFNPAVELKGPNGREVAAADDFFYLPDPILSCVIPEDGVYTLTIHDNLYRGRSDFAYMIRCYEDKPDGPHYTPQQRAFECFAEPFSHKPPQSVKGGEIFKGVIDCPNRIIRHKFKIDEPKSMLFEMYARRNGSPLDGVVKLYGPLKPGVPVAQAPLLAEWDDIDKFLAGSIPQAICDPRGGWNFLEAGEYCVSVSDRSNEGGPDYSYTLCISPLEPDFEVYSHTSSFIMNGNSAHFKARIVPLNGFKGEVTFDSNDEFSCSTSPSDKPDWVEVSVSPKTDWKGMKFATLTASAEIAPGKTRTVKVTPCDSVEQAFAYTHLLPTHAFYFYNPED